MQSGTNRTARFILLLLSVLSALAGHASPAIFDTHIHYNGSLGDEWTEDRILKLLKLNQVKYALVTGIPNAKTLSLYHQSPEVIIPFVSVYQHSSDKQNWHQNQSLLKPLLQQLRQHKWAGIGELHLFAKDRQSEVFESILDIANQYHLTLLMHSDPVVIDHIYQLYPDSRVIWAHAGTFPYPPLLRDYLTRYSGLYLDISMRNSQIAPNGLLDPEWEALLLEFSDRILIGVDTYSSLRWRQYPQIIAQTRQWLMQLPVNVQLDIGFRNAVRLLKRQSIR